MTPVPLPPSWEFIDADPQGDTADFSSRPATDHSAWRPISAPGDVNAALVAAGVVPDPRHDTQGRQLYWISSRDWWFRCAFSAPDLDPTRTELCFGGIDGHADVWLNGTPLGTARNAHREHRFPVAGALRPGSNELWLRFHAIDGVLRTPRLDELAGWRGRRALMRKAGFTFGWDWALPLPTIGLTEAPRLESEADLRMIDFSLRPFCSGRVDLAFEVTPAAKSAGYEIRIALDGPNAALRRTHRRNAHKSYVSVQVDDPRLWWPNGAGEAALYDYSVELLVGGRVVDARQGRFGFRESRIVERPFTEEAGPGFSFEIEINGETIFCKGGNIIPLDLAPGLVPDEAYRWYLERARDAGFNMLRVWGGGIYEREIFYRLCDEFGLMVWQDFMFASTGYPVDRLRDEIIAETSYQLRRLRNHPCIVIWCGGNEDVHSWHYHAGDEVVAQEDTGPHAEVDPEFVVDRMHDDPQLYSMILRGSVSLLGLGVPFIESSPASRDDYGNLPNSGNCHISCWKTALFDPDRRPQDFRKHFEAVCSFDSEFCIQGPCSAEALRTFLAPENHWPPNEAWIYHLQRGHQNIPHYEQTLFIAGAIFGEIDSLESYVKHGQATHLEMMRAEFESARRDRPNNGGTMMWMYNDCWPTANWSIIDFYRQPKPSYYAAKRACAPLLPIIFERGERVEFFLGNDSREDVGEVAVRYGVENLAGARRASREATVRVPVNGTVRFAAMARDELDLRPDEFVFLDATVSDRALPRVTYFPNGWKDVPWPEPGLRAEITVQSAVGDRWRTTLVVATDRYARIAHVLHPTQRDFWASDNYFDLPAGERRTITIDSAAPFTAAELTLGHWLTPWR